MKICVSITLHPPFSPHESICELPLLNIVHEAFDYPFSNKHPIQQLRYVRKKFSKPRKKSLLSTWAPASSKKSAATFLLKKAQIMFPQDHSCPSRPRLPFQALDGGDWHLQKRAKHTADPPTYTLNACPSTCQTLAMSEVFQENTWKKKDAALGWINKWRERRVRSYYFLFVGPIFPTKRSQTPIENTTI